MKKVLALLCAAAMSVALVACGGGNAPAKTEAGKSEAPAASAEASQAAPADALKVGVFYYDYADSYIATVRSEMDKMLTELGVEFTNYDGAGSQPTQSDAVNTALTQGVNLLVVNVVETDSDAAQQICDAAKTAGIPVIFFNREVKDDVIKSYDKAAFVGTNAPEAGHLQGEMIGKYLLENFEKVDLNGDGKISYVMFKGQEGNPEAEARTQYAVEDADKILKDAGKEVLSYFDEKASSKYLADQNGKWSSQAANDYMNTILSTYNDGNKNMVEMVIANNDDMALGAITVLQQNDYNKEGGEKKIPVFGVDATDTAKAAIEAGTMTGSIKQDNVGMASSITALVKAVKEGKNPMDGATGLNVDEGVAKIRVPYQIWTGKK